MNGSSSCSCSSPGSDTTCSWSSTAVTVTSKQTSIVNEVCWGGTTSRTSTQTLTVPSSVRDSQSVTSSRTRRSGVGNSGDRDNGGSPAVRDGVRPVSNSTSCPSTSLANADALTTTVLLSSITKDGIGSDGLGGALARSNEVTTRAPMWSTDTLSSALWNPGATP